MFPAIVLLFEAVSVVFIGIFARSTDTTITTSTNGITNNYLISQSLILLFGFTLMYSAFRKLTMFSFVNLIIVISIAAQTNILFGTFWDSCFNGFSSSFQITALLLIKTVFSCLSVLLTVLDFIGLFDYWQIYLIIAPIMTIGYSLNSAIIIYGLKTFDGGGAFRVFLYSGIFSLMIWAFCIRGKIDHDRYRIKESYVNKMLGFIGVAVSFFNWPVFNMAGANLTALVSASTTTSLQNSSRSNTYLGLSAAILVSVLFASKETKEEKLKYNVYIDGFINSGIVIASFQDTLLNPTASLIIASFTTICTLVIHKYFLTQSETEAEGIFKKMMRNYSKIIYRIIFSFIGSIVAAIVVITRDGQSPALLSNNYSRTAGFQIAAWILVSISGAFFGVIASLSINAFIRFKKNEAAQLNEEELTIVQAADSDFFQGFLNDQIHPLYYDIFQQIDKKQKQKLNLAEYTTRVIKQSLLVAQDNPLRMMSVIKRAETQADPRQARLVIQKDYSKSNFKAGEVSKMKVNSQFEEEGAIQDRRQKEVVANLDKEPKIQKTKLKISEGEAVPRPNKDNIKRKLEFEQQSEIKHQNVEKSKVRQ